MKTTTKNIISKLLNDGFVDMETETDILTVHFRKFFNTNKSFLFILNTKAVFGCKTKATAIKKINDFISKGFILSVDI